MEGDVSVTAAIPFSCPTSCAFQLLIQAECVNLKIDGNFFVSGSVFITCLYIALHGGDGF